MRYLFLLALLAGCVNPEVAAMDRCERFGFARGTSEFGNCMIEMYKTHQQQSEQVIYAPAPQPNVLPSPLWKSRDRTTCNSYQVGTQVQTVCN